MKMISKIVSLVNKGLRRRFHSHYNIKGYEAPQLREIFVRKIQETPFDLNVPTSILDKFFVDKKTHFKYFGGDVEKLIAEIKQCQALRAFNSGITNKTIIMDDITQAIKHMESMSKKEYQAPFGLYV